MFVGSVNNGVYHYTYNEDDGTLRQVYTAGVNGSLITAIFFVHYYALGDSVDTDAILYLKRGGVTYHLARVTIPYGAGSRSDVLPYSVLNQAVLPFLDDTSSLRLEGGDELWFTIPETLHPLTEWVNLFVVGGDY